MQLTELVKNWSGTSTSGLRKDGKLDRRRISKSVLQEAWVMGIVSKQGFFVSGTVYQSHWETTLLWEMLKEAIDSNAGRSLSSSRVWRDLGIWESGHKWHTEQMLQEMEAILVALDLAGYIYFNSAGSIWSINIKVR